MLFWPVFTLKMHCVQFQEVFMHEKVNEDLERKEHDSSIFKQVHVPTKMGIKALKYEVTSDAHSSQWSTDRVHI